MGCRTQGDGPDPRPQDAGYWAEMSPHSRPNCVQPSHTGHPGEQGHLSRETAAPARGTQAQAVPKVGSEKWEVETD